MNAQAEKLELMQLLLNTDNEDALKKVKAILKKYAGKSETEYLLSTEANSKHLLQGIDELNKGNKKAIKTSDLWK
jgi:hypothetical protein